MREFKRNEKGKFGRKGFERSDGKFQKRDRFPPKDFGSRNRSSQLQFFEATCARCGRDCEVPFRPSGAKPVLCRNCFQQKDAPMPQAKPGQSQSNELIEINRKLDKILRALNLD